MTLSSESSDNILVKFFGKNLLEKKIRIEFLEDENYQLLLNFI